MSKIDPTNISASVRARLLNLAQKDQRPFEELLQYYAMERFLYRLSQSKHANRYILKGALMFKVWEPNLRRPTISPDFVKTKQTQWTAFRKKLEQEFIPESFQEIISSLENFLRPAITAISTGMVNPGRWAAPGPWA